MLGVALRVQDMTWVPGGALRLRSDQHCAEKAPPHHATVGGFRIDRTPVRTRAFRKSYNSCRRGRWYAQTQEG
jgi:formylglycine-generating enzyme required for sulfatase activity